MYSLQYYSGSTWEIWYLPPIYNLTMSKVKMIIVNHSMKWDTLLADKTKRLVTFLTTFLPYHGLLLGQHMFTHLLHRSVDQGRVLLWRFNVRYVRSVREASIVSPCLSRDITEHTPLNFTMDGLEMGSTGLPQIKFCFISIFPIPQIARGIMRYPYLQTPWTTFFG